MPCAANIPAPRSAIGTPSLNGGPSDSPVRLMSPPSAWITASSPGWSLGAGLTVSGNRAIDQPRERRRQRRIVEPVAGQRAGPEVLHQDVGASDERIEHTTALGMLEVERHALFVSIDAEKVSALAAEKRRPPGPGVVPATGLFDLDDARSHVGEQHGAVRAGEHPRQVEHHRSGERSDACCLFHAAWGLQPRTVDRRMIDERCVIVTGDSTDASRQRVWNAASSAQVSWGPWPRREAAPRSAARCEPRRSSMHQAAHLNRTALEALQGQRLSRLMSETHRRNAFYRQKFDEAGVRVDALRLPADLPALPCTTKAELIADQTADPPWGTALSEPVERYTRFCQTSSTTGRPLRWLDTNESWQWMLDCWKTVYRAAGVRRATGCSFRSRSDPSSASGPPSMRQVRWASCACPAAGCRARCVWR